ncbi:hypothetical protein LTR47_009304 [Exophiala xenobiotica]|nr:hypothetical protein LTR47_009304 [Exophiala xenobiotica]KAK5253537.1 hypothetical protein LTS06_001969 [Exophiala xenobiotica]KAK5349592.1 hypothetical protein LTR61_006982 [Exophiala xenobiotica]KAK5373316.1 hypothetical protein LTR11_006056 [Exophiala xenobiotica]KAK5376728.1 hypothetical protein LTS03_005497 [Exophiala xenobiotica]
MSVSGYSVQHDPEVQAYNKLRATYLAAEKERKRHEKETQKQEDKDKEQALLESSKEDQDRWMKSSQTGNRNRNRNRNVISRILHPVRTKRDERLLAEVMGEKFVDSPDSDLDEISLKDALR